jgi:hypothetical protein
MYKGYRSRKKNKDKYIKNEIEKNIIMSNISNRSKLENRTNKVNYTKNLLLGEKSLSLLPSLETSQDKILNEGNLIEFKEGEIVYDLNTTKGVELDKKEKNEILEDIDKILMSRDINDEIDNYYNKYNEESFLDLEKDKEGYIDEESVYSNIECIKKNKDLICYGLLNKTELNELNNYLNSDKDVEKKNTFTDKNTLFSEKEDNSFIKELTFNPNIYMEMVGECKIEKIQESSIKKEKSYYDRVVDNLYKLFTPK